MRIKGARQRTKNFIIMLLTVLVFSMSFPVTAGATENTKKQLEEAKEKKEQSQSELDNTKDDIAEMNEEKSSLQGQLNNLNAQLNEVSNNLEELEEQIDNKRLR